MKGGLLVLVVAAVAALGGAAAATGDPLARAAAKSAQAESLRFTLTARFEAPRLPRPATTSGAGVASPRGGAYRVALDMTEFARALGEPTLRGTIRAIVLGRRSTITYISLPALTRQLPRGKTWLRLDPKGAARIGLDPSTLLSGADIGAAFDYLRATVGPPTRVGREQVAGVATTHYRTKLDMRKAARFVDAQTARTMRSLVTPVVPLDVWVGDDGYVRREDFGFRVTSGSVRIDVAFSMTMRGYGAAARIGSPPARLVATLEQLRR